MTFIPPHFNPPEFSFEKAIEVKWDVFVDFDVDITKDIDVDFDVWLNIEGNSTVSAFDIEDLRPSTVPTGSIQLVNVSVEDTSSLVQFQLPTTNYTIQGQSSATGTHVDTFAELTINLLVPATGGFHFVATGESAVEPFTFVW
jgi:hypothetical protein